MSCSFHQDLSPYLDGELDNQETKKMREHLKACVDCREELNLMVQVRNSLKQVAASTKAPPLLKERILREAHQTRSVVLIPRWSFAYGVPLVAMLLFAIILIFYYYRPAERPSFTNVLTVLVEYHAAYRPGGRSASIKSSDLQDIESWLESQMGFKALIPNAAFAGYDLAGADIFEQRGRKFVYLKYQRDGGTIGYTIFKDFGLSLDLPESVDVGEIKLHIGKEKEINFAVWKKRGVVYLILTAEDRSDLLEYARLCIQLF